MANSINDWPKISHRSKRRRDPIRARHVVSASARDFPFVSLALGLVKHAILRVFANSSASLDSAPTTCRTLESMPSKLEINLANVCVAQRNKTG